MKLFNLFRPKKRAPLLVEDFHTHLLPGVDDGAPTLSETMDLLAEMAHRGVKHIHFTPHCYHPLYPNRLSTLQPLYDRYLPQLQERFPTLRFSLGGELRISFELLEAIEKGEPLPVFGENCLLLENSLVECSEYLEPIQFELSARGYRLVMAHPERYPYYHDSFRNYQKLRDEGWLFQLNLSSKAGRYGETVARITRKLEHAGFADFYGSDLHGQRHLKYI